jgi:hypothetical protein
MLANGWSVLAMIWRIADLVDINKLGIMDEIFFEKKEE